MCIKSTPENYSNYLFFKSNQRLSGDVTRELIRCDDFLRNTALQCCNNVATISNNVATMLQRCVAHRRFD